MKKRMISALLLIVMLIGLFPAMPIQTEAATTLSSQPNAKVNYEYSASVEVGTIRYMAQDSGTTYFNWNYWPKSSFGSYASPETECGTASMSMALSYVGVNKTPKDLLGTDGITRYIDWGDAIHSAPTFSAAMTNYINGNEKYSPVVICLEYAGSYNSDLGKNNDHYIVIVGKTSETSYQYLNPWSSGGNGLGTSTISGSTATYGSSSYRIKQVHQWYNPKATPPMVAETYRCYGELTITKDGSYMKSLPCSQETSADSETVEPAKKGSTYTAIQLVRNTPGNLWYKVISKSGEEGYIYSGDAAFKQLTSDLYVDGIAAPDEHKKGAGFGLEGTINAKYQELYKVGAWVSTLEGEFVTGDTENITASSYNLLNSYLNEQTRFSKLEVGNYIYKIAAIAGSYYAKTSTEIGTAISETVDLFGRSFSVSESVSGDSGGSSTAKTHTITFQANGGTCSTTTVKVTDGSRIGVLPTCDLDNYDFEGWSTEPFGGKEVTAETVPTGDMTLWARYSNSAFPNRLEFDTNGGVLPEPVLVEVIDGANRDRPGESLVVFNKSGTQPGTNTYGKEIAVNAEGKITAFRDYGDSTQLTVPNGGFILSGQQGWDSEAGVHVGGSEFIRKIRALDEAYVLMDYETGEIKVYDSYAGYLAAIKRGREYTTYGILPVPVREGYTFRGWRDSFGGWADYYSSFAGIELTAEWDENTSLNPTAVMEYNGHYYEVYDHNVTWTEARALCESMGGYLVTITSAAEQTAIMELLEGSRRGSYRIGATDEEKEGTWTWVTGEIFSYSNWDPEYPEPNTEAGKNYASLIAIENPPNKEVGEWFVSNAVYYSSFYDISNTGFICEFDQPKTCQHRYTYTVRQDPTEETTGILRAHCNICGEGTDIVLPILNKTDYKYDVLIEANCVDIGLVLYTWTAPDGTAFEFVVSLPLTAHDCIGVRTEATCMDPGYTTFTCTFCGYSYVEYDEVARGHTRVVEAAIAPTCTTAGLTEGVYCSACGEILVVQTVVDALGHTEVVDAAVAPTCTSTGLTEGKHCDRCGEVLAVQDVISALGHSYACGGFIWAEDYTCSAEFHCDMCGDAQTVVCDVTSVTYPATETEDGSIVYTAYAEFEGAGYTDIFTVILPAIGPTAQLVVDTTSARAGETVTVAVSIQNNPGFAGMAYDVCFDDTVLELVSYELGLGSNICVDSGVGTYSNKVNFQYAGTSNFTGDEALVTFTFKVKDTAEAGLTEITVIPEDGTVFRYEGRTEVEFTLTAVNGGAEIVDYLMGDVNDDGKVNNRDAARILQYLAGWDVDFVEAAADVTGDGKVNNRDAARILQYLAGWDVVIN